MNGGTPRRKQCTRDADSETLQILALRQVGFLPPDFIRRCLHESDAGRSPSEESFKDTLSLVLRQLKFKLEVTSKHKRKDHERYKQHYQKGSNRSS